MDKTEEDAVGFVYLWNISLLCDFFNAGDELVNIKMQRQKRDNKEQNIQVSYCNSNLLIYFWCYSYESFLGKIIDKWYIVWGVLYEIHCIRI